MSWLLGYIMLAWCIRLAMLPVVLRRKFSPGGSLAWLSIVFIHPYIGALLYFLIGESPLGRRRAALHREVAALLGARHSPPGTAPRSAPPGLDRCYDAIVLQAEKISGMPIVEGNDVE